MFIAINKNKETTSVRDVRLGEKYFCPLCNEEVTYRKCTTKASHFAHKRGSDCSDWGDMSEWHLSWQEKFPIECREVVVEKNGVKHRADILVKEKKLVIEFQHSPISNEEFYARNKFYTENGYRIIWIFDGEKKIKNPEEYSAGISKSNLNLYTCNDQKLEWKRYKKDNELLTMSNGITVLYEVYNRELKHKILLPVVRYSNFDIYIGWMVDYIYPESFLKSYSKLYKHDEVKSYEELINDTNKSIPYIQLTALMNNTRYTGYRPPTRRNFRF